MKSWITLHIATINILLTENKRWSRKISVPNAREKPAHWINCSSLLDCDPCNAAKCSERCCVTIASHISESYLEAPLTGAFLLARSCQSFYLFWPRRVILQPHHFHWATHLLPLDACYLHTPLVLPSQSDKYIKDRQAFWLVAMDRQTAADEGAAQIFHVTISKSDIGGATASHTCAEEEWDYLRKTNETVVLKSVSNFKS